jgi:hypothetical protein
MTLTFIFMMVVLKIPILALLWIVWWAIKQQPDAEGGNGGDGGIRSEPRFPHHPRRRPPRGPRRGPHSDPGSGSPPRTRRATRHVTPIEARHARRLPAAPSRS